MAKTMSKNITQFETWEMAEQVGKDIPAVLQEFAASRGLSITFGGIGRVDSDKTKVTLEVSVIAETARLATEAETQRQEYIEKAVSLGLKLEWLDDYFFVDKGRSLNTYTIVGLKVSSPKFPVIVRQGDKRYGYSLEGTKKGMENHERIRAEVAAKKAAAGK
jgi:hypothetical protein